MIEAIMGLLKHYTCQQKTYNPLEMCKITEIAICQVNFKIKNKSFPTTCKYEIYIMATVLKLCSN